MRVLALTKYGREAASTRYRLLQFLPALNEAGISVTWRSLLSDDYVRGLVSGERPSRLAIMAGYARRVGDVRRARTVDLLWVYAELFPYLPAWLERLALPSNVPVVIDWDDAFHVPYRDHRSRAVRALLGRKFEELLGGVDAVTCGNSWLQKYARRFCSLTPQVPTVVDTDHYLPRAATDRPPVIGWIGSPSTWPNVRPLLPLLRRLHQRYGVRTRAIGAGQAAERDQFDGLDLIEWQEETEVAEVQRFTIGIMPLLDLPFQRGKSGFKLIQYMACGVPVVASPVGVNRKIVEDGRSGLLATETGEWERALIALVEDVNLRAYLGAAGRARAVAHYSLASQAPRLITLFREVVRSRGARVKSRGR